MKVKQARPQKYTTREYNRCKICGRPHAYIRKYGICRVCFRELAHKGEIPGVKKASWQNLDEIKEKEEKNEYNRSNRRYVNKNQKCKHF